MIIAMVIIIIFIITIAIIVTAMVGYSNDDFIFALL